VSSLRNARCALAPEGWQCIRDIGHDGPCAPAPLTGSGACPDIEECMFEGCQAKCGPDDRRKSSIWRHRPVRYAAYAGVFAIFLAEYVVSATRSALWEYPLEWRWQWSRFKQHLREVEGTWS
jgi:hypothetical protein